MLGACTAISGPERAISTDGLSIEKTSPIFSLFKKSYADSSENPLVSSYATEFFNAGVSVSSSLCSDFFYQLGQEEQRFDYAQRQSGLLGNSIATILGALKASSEAVALTGAGFTLFTGSLSTYRDVFLFSPEVASVEELIAKAQRAYISKISESPPDLKDPLISYDGKGFGDHTRLL
jgi:hypothetical protein